MKKIQLECILFRRINRLLEEYKLNAPSVMIKLELSLIKDACEELIDCYSVNNYQIGA